MVSLVFSAWYSIPKVVVVAEGKSDTSKLKILVGETPSKIPKVSSLKVVLISVVRASVPSLFGSWYVRSVAGSIPWASNLPILLGLRRWRFQNGITKSSENIVCGCECAVFVGYCEHPSRSGRDFSSVKSQFFEVSAAFWTEKTLSLKTLVISSVVASVPSLSGIVRTRVVLSEIALHSNFARFDG